MIKLFEYPDHRWSAGRMRAVLLEQDSRGRSYLTRGQGTLFLSDIGPYMSHAVVDCLRENPGKSGQIVSSLISMMAYWDCENHCPPEDWVP